MQDISGVNLAHLISLFFLGDGFSISLTTCYGLALTLVFPVSPFLKCSLLIRFLVHLFFDSCFLCLAVGFSLLSAAVATVFCCSCVLVCSLLSLGFICVWCSAVTEIGLVNAVESRTLSTLYL